MKSVAVLIGQTITLVFTLSGLFVFAGIAQEQTIEQRIAACQGCHGAEGIPISADIPILAGL